MRSAKRDAPSCAAPSRRQARSSRRRSSSRTSLMPGSQVLRRTTRGSRKQRKITHLGEAACSLHELTYVMHPRQLEKEHVMKPWVKVAVVTALFAVPAMALGQVIWPPAPGGPEPSAGQLPFFILLAVFEALTFGLGVSFLLFGFVPLRRALGGSSWRTWAA